ncbi:uncharacterized protein HD556DRAFT_1307288 [Suillus plorans]|uniref:Heterokaryon incompatibility domain-containing protein n=1 Tax=Suillus plorans TaxID=116603 RepID=A0A9P7AT47_9AGAM|nr:uncharacterized protein HD556DRAFT_1307288 [Suillus plorans]KAG1796080.1 hypothetical protein HD556DRAFT_1307288 [Suillus plorans]
MKMVIKAKYLEWSNAFTEEYSALCLANGDTALAASDYDRAKVIEFNPSSHVGYELMHTALRGAQRYDEAIEAFKIMLSKLDDSPEAQIRDLRQQYVSPSEAEDAIQRVVRIELECAPLRLLNTSTEYNELVSFPTKDSNLRAERIKDVVATYFRCVLLSHRWEKMEALLHDIQDKYKSNTELQESVNSYRHSALAIVHLCDVSPSSQPGALARSVWNKRGWTFQDFVASKVVIFYQNDWSLYLGDRSPNHKESPRLQWASSRVTTLQEDVADSLFGIFGAHLPVIYGEKKQNALGRLLQETVARSGDITVIDWVGQPSEFNSCLPAYITSYRLRHSSTYTSIFVRRSDSDDYLLPAKESHGLVVNQ